MLSLNHVTKEYVLDEKTVVAPIKDISLDIQNAEFIIIIGRSGSGKTTLLNLAAGLIKPTAGQVSIDGTDLQTLPDKELSLLRNRKIGFIFQFPSLMPSLTAKENVALPTFLQQSSRTGKNSMKKAADLLEIMGIGSRINSYPRQLSAGEQKRVVIARALINNPDILLADEPTSDLDSETEQETMQLLKEVNAKGVMFIMVTHSLDLIPYAHRAFKLEHSKLFEVNHRRQ